MKKLHLFLFSFLMIAPVAAQSVLSLDSSDSQVKVTGTSSVHDWESNVEEFSGAISFSVVDEDGILQIDELTFSAITKSIKSGKSVMDRKTRGALKEGDYPEIIFSYTEVLEQTPDLVTIAGDLALAGTTLPVQITASYFVLEDGTLNVTGSQEINMKDYGISPPTAMMGTLKTGELVYVDFDVIFTDN